jgi:hypothetical protein
MAVRLTMAFDPAVQAADCDIKSAVPMVNWTIFPV